ncbi:MAG: hypothetical protein LH606_12560 [Cytophagaceae bacterium]|nr:hypothetical protein [Cytophagaceae bacterium]
MKAVFALTGLLFFTLLGLQTQITLFELKLEFQVYFELNYHQGRIGQNEHQPENNQYQASNISHLNSKLYDKVGMGAAKIWS